MSRTLLNLWYALHYYGALAAFMAGLVVLQIGGFLLWPVPGARWKNRLAQASIHRFFRLYRAYFHWSGALRVRFTGWPDDLGSRGCVVVANHITLIDAPLFFARLPRAICLFKGSLQRSLLGRNTIRFTGYVSNTNGLDGFRKASDCVREGGQFVVFPEGTRGGGLGDLHGGHALVAHQARVPIEVFAIQTNSNALCKGYPLKDLPVLPMRMEVRHLGRFDPQHYARARDLHDAVATCLKQALHAPAAQPSHSPAPERVYPAASARRADRAAL